MKGLTLENIALACKGELRNATKSQKQTEVSDVVIDSRKVCKDALFIAIKGERVDGHTFIPMTYENGAICTISEQELEIEQPYIRVASSLQAIKDLAEFYLKGLSCKVVGISGSVGKTSTKEMIASVLSEKYHVLKTEGNFNNEIGLPLTVFRLREEHEIAVLEMGISGFGEMSRLAKVAKPDVAVLTNIGLCHLENLKSRDGILKAKTEMFDFLKADATVILNGDDDKLATVSDVQGRKPTFFGINNHELCRFFGTEIAPKGIEGISVTLEDKNQNVKFRADVHIPGMHMVYNALAGTAVGMHFGLKTEEIQAGIEKLVPVSGRNNIIKHQNYTIIDDCYNANPVSMRASIDVLSYAEGRKVAVLGDMFELGQNEGRLHAEIGTYLKDKEIDVVILAGQLMKHAYETLHDVLEHTQVFWFESTDAVLGELKSIVKEHDTILVKASHGMQFSKIVDLLKAE